MTKIKKILQLKKANIDHHSPRVLSCSERLSESLSVGYFEYTRTQDIEIIVHRIRCFNSTN